MKRREELGLIVNWRAESSPMKSLKNKSEVFARLFVRGKRTTEILIALKKDIREKRKGLDDG